MTEILSNDPNIRAIAFAQARGQKDPEVEESTAGADEIVEEISTRPSRSYGSISGFNETSSDDSSPLFLG